MHRSSITAPLWCLLAAIWVAPAAADSLELHLASTHLCDCDYRETNPGIGYTRMGWDGPGDGWTAGVYRNSIERTTAYAGAVWRWREHALVQPELVAGVVTGYTDRPLPAVIPRIRLDPPGPLGAVVTGIPAKDSALGLSATWNW